MIAGDVENFATVVFQHSGQCSVTGKLADHIGRDPAAVVGMCGMAAIDAVVRVGIVGVDVYEDLAGFVSGKGPGAPTAGGDVMFGDAGKRGGAVDSAVRCSR